VDNGKIIYTPNANFVGNDSLSYIVSDGKGGTATATVTVTTTASLTPTNNLFLPLVNR